MTQQYLFDRGYKDLPAKAGIVTRVEHKVEVAGVTFWSGQRDIVMNGAIINSVAARGCYIDKKHRKQYKVGSHTFALPRGWVVNRKKVLPQFIDAADKTLTPLLKGAICYYVNYVQGFANSLHDTDCMLYAQLFDLDLNTLTDDFFQYVICGDGWQDGKPPRAKMPYYDKALRQAKKLRKNKRKQRSNTAAAVKESMPIGRNLSRLPLQAHDFNECDFLMVDTINGLLQMNKCKVKGVEVLRFVEEEYGKEYILRIRCNADHIRKAAGLERRNNLRKTFLRYIRSHGNGRKFLFRRHKMERGQLIPLDDKKDPKIETILFRYAKETEQNPTNVVDFKSGARFVVDGKETIALDMPDYAFETIYRMINGGKVGKKEKRTWSGFKSVPKHFFVGLLDQKLDGAEAKTAYKVACYLKNTELSTVELKTMAQHVLPSLLRHKGEYWKCKPDAIRLFDKIFVAINSMAKGRAALPTIARRGDFADIDRATERAPLRQTRIKT